MRIIDKTYITVLGATAVAAIVLGIYTIVRAQGPAYQRARQASQIITANLENAEDVLRTLQQYPDELAQIRDVAVHAGRTARQMPTVMKAGTEMLGAVSEVMANSAKTIREVEATFDIVLPGKLMLENARALEEASEHASVLHHVLLEAHRRADATRTQADQAGRAMQTLGRALRKATPGLDAMAERVHRMRVLSEEADLGRMLAGSASMAGGLYILAGLILAGLAGLWYRILNIPPPRR